MEFIDAELHASDAVPVNRLDRSRQTLKTRKCTAMKYKHDNIQSAFWTQTIGSWLLLQQNLYLFLFHCIFQHPMGKQPQALSACITRFGRKVSWRIDGGSSRKKGCCAQTIHLYPFLLSLRCLVMHRLWRANIDHFHASFPGPCCQVVCLCWHLTAQVLGKRQWKAQ